MCGIAGFTDISAVKQAETLATIAESMASAIAYRGPDDSGVWVDSEVGIGLSHRRLSILDLSPEGHQPMQSSNGRFVMVFNGEIYNFGELRKELQQSGHRFRGHSDTEVMLAAFLEWGIPESCCRFNGMFAFAVWDKTNRVLSLGRDRLGKKPLYYGWCGKSFLFGSELKALLAYPTADLQIDRDVLAVFMRHGYIPGVKSIYHGIYRLRPGSLLSLTPNKEPGRLPEPQQYWSAKEAVERGISNPLQGSREEMLENLNELLKSAVQSRMISDVPLGAFLSGGIDSSLVVSLMQAASSQAVKTFSIGFHETGYDEAGYASAVARHLGTDHTELYVTPREAMDVIPLLPEMYDEPFADNSQIPTFLVSKLARQRVTVSLSGDGGDELFGGYGAYFSVLRSWTKYARIPTAMRKVLGRGLRALDSGTWDQVFNGWGVRSMGDAGDRVHRLASTLSQSSDETIYRNLISNWEEPGLLVRGTCEPQTAFTNEAEWANLPTFFEKMMYLDAVTYLCDDILTKVDRASMAVSLESRCPLLDYRLFEFAWRMPLNTKVDREQGKTPLRELLYRYVPRELVDRPKAGFALPVGQWLRGPMKDWAEALLAPSRLEKEGFLAPKLVSQTWAAHLAGSDQTARLWNVLMFQSWHEAQSPSAGKLASLDHTPATSLT